MTLALLPLVLFSYELGLSDVKTPTIYNQFATEFSFQHRFYGSLATDPFGTFLGADAGANANIGLSFFPIKGLGIDVSRVSSDGGNLNLGAGYSFPLPKEYLRWRAGGELLSYLDPNDTTRWMPLAHLTLQTEPILERIKPSLSVTYGGLFLFSGGISATIIKDLWIFEEIALLAEYYLRQFAVEDTEYVFKSSYVAGIGASTYGHQFLITLSNTTDIGTRVMGGVSRHMDDEETYIHLGFTIRRLLIRGKES